MSRLGGARYARLICGRYLGLRRTSEASRMDPREGACPLVGGYPDGDKKQRQGWLADQ